ncbi:Cdc6-related protein, AAA superfamily ATPase [Geodermatophilus nigrescens]|uniref:Cdc6-related protein, AAA superfamily ATPase n=1 Tax=Geodermatophilus nigrescens TaxID=1070870 RepID=A0A1M5DYE5_9ACTN|nr:Cdc6-related protein, AAA superfamily ATPase [Geodermatophilus nigrescens]
MKRGDVAGPSGIEEMQQRLDYVLRPNKPIDSEALLAGRADQLQDLTTAIRMPGAHALVYGDRGVGKTSLAATAQSLHPGRAISVRINCAPDTSWSSLWGSIAAEISSDYLSSPHADQLSDAQIGAYTQAVDGLDRVTNVAQVVAPLRLLGFESPSLIVIDEFDKIEDEDVKESIANLIKALSDKAIPSTLVVVGVAHNADELFFEHESIKRSLKQVRMPRLSPEELTDVIAVAERELKIRCAADVRDRITLLSRGLPFYTHLVAWYCFEGAILERRSSIGSDDLREAQRRASRGLQEDLGKRVDQSVHSSYPGNKYWDVCVAAACAPTDRSGFFQMRDLRPVLEARTDRSYANFAFKKHLDEFCSERGPLMEAEQRGRGSTVYRFLDPLMAPYILIRESASAPLSPAIYEQLTVPGL